MFLSARVPGEGRFKIEKGGRQWQEVGKEGNRLWFR
jgi:hypothetical protein